MAALALLVARSQLPPSQPAGTTTVQPAVGAADYVEHFPGGGKGPQIHVYDGDGHELSQLVFSRSDSVKIVASGFNPGAKLTESLSGSPLPLRSMRANGRGQASLTYVLPKDVGVGAHTLVLRSDDLVAALGFSVPSHP